jgi:hypothetical protein
MDGKFAANMLANEKVGGSLKTDAGACYSIKANLVNTGLLAAVNNGRLLVRGKP